MLIHFLVMYASVLITPEEEALRALLANRPVQAVRALEGAPDDPYYSWLAGMTALGAGDYSKAASLFSGDEPSVVWGMTEVLLGEGKSNEASALALSEMDAALEGKHRDALAGMMLDQARARMENDISGAERILWGILQLDASEEFVKEAEDALFFIYGTSPGTMNTGLIDIALKRLDSIRELSKDQKKKEHDISALLIAGLHFRGSSPSRAYEYLLKAGENGDERGAAIACEAVTVLKIPPEWKLDLLNKAAERFPDSEKISERRLVFGSQLAMNDEVSGIKALSLLYDDKHKGVEAREAVARATSSHLKRRELRLAIAEKEGRSAVAERARRNALDDLVLHVESEYERDKAAGRKSAREALKEPDGKNHPLFLYKALDDGLDRMEALWDLAGKFSEKNGPWCLELSEKLIDAGAGIPESEKFIEVCPDIESPLMEAFHVLGGDEPQKTTFLKVRARNGYAEVISAGSDKISVSQHSVDPEVILRTSYKNPLDTKLDTLLVAPDRSWEIETDSESISTIDVRMQRPGLLQTLTIRAGSKYAAILLPGHQLDVQSVLTGNTLAVAVLDGASPVRRASILALDSEGKSHNARTDANGIAVLENVSGPVRIMAQTRRALGFAVNEGLSHDSFTERPIIIVSDEMAAPPDGLFTRIRVFSMGEDKNSDNKIVLKSQSRKGKDLHEKTLVLRDGYAEAGLFIQGGGKVMAIQDRNISQVLDIAHINPDFPLSIILSPPVPGPDDDFSVTVASRKTLPIDGLEAVLTISDGRRMEEHEILLVGEPVTIPYSLKHLSPGNQVSIILEVKEGVVVPGHQPASHHSARRHSAYYDRFGKGRQDKELSIPGFIVPSRRVNVNFSISGSPPLSPVGIPERIIPGHSFGMDDEWRILRGPNGYPKIWAAPGEELSVPGRESLGRNNFDYSGIWNFSYWKNGLESQTVGIQMISEESPMSIDGTWKGAFPALASLVSESGRDISLLRPGENIGIFRDEGWIRISHGPGMDVEYDDASLCIPPATKDLPEIIVEAKLHRGKESQLDLLPGFPEGTRIWALLRDGSAAGASPDLRVYPYMIPSGPGFASAFREPESVLGIKVYDALLMEEERIAERAPPARVMPSLHDVSMESAKMQSIMGYGAGGGGFGRASLAGEAARRHPVHRTSLPYQIHPIERFDGVEPGRLTFKMPDWVAAAELDMIIRLPDRTIISHRSVLPVGGPSPSSYPAHEAEEFSDKWDGSFEELRNIAFSLPVDERIYALAALAGEDEISRLMLSAALEMSGSGPGRSMAYYLGHGEVPRPGPALQRLEGLSDPHRVERVLAALEAAPGSPELAASAAMRLLREADLSPWVRAKAGLVLMISGNMDAAAAAFEGKERVPAACRVVAGIEELGDNLASGLYHLARNNAANPFDRALAIHALSKRTGKGVVASAQTPPPGSFKLRVMPPLAAMHGLEFMRGGLIMQNISYVPDGIESITAFPANRTVPVEVTIQPFQAPGRIRCPGTGIWSSEKEWIDIPASAFETKATCHVRASEAGTSEMEIRHHGPCGRTVASGSAKVTVTEPEKSSPDDYLSPDEKYGLGIFMSHKGIPGVKPLLEPLLGLHDIGPRTVSALTEALFLDAMKSGNPRELVFAFEAARERSRHSTLNLERAKAVAHAYAGIGEHERSVSAAKTVLDARFREELGAIRYIQSGNLPFTALALLRELMKRYPETETVVQARYLAPSILLEAADGDGDRLGYTRSSLRHTAAGDLAAFLTIHPDNKHSSEAAVLLVETLNQMRDNERVRAITGPLASKYGNTESGWWLSMADVRALFDSGDLSAAGRVLDAMPDIPEARALMALERGRIAEARGQTRQALEHYRKSYETEAVIRAEWLERKSFEPPHLLVQRRRDNTILDASVIPRTRVELAATRLVLENLFLRDGGDLQPDDVTVNGMRVEQSITARADSTGRIPLPQFKTGAWMVTADMEGGTRRFLVLRTDLFLDVRESSQGGSMIYLMDRRGRPVKGADVWAVGANDTYTAVTDSLGSAWLPEAGGSAILARAGEEYAYWSPPSEEGVYSDPVHGYPGKASRIPPAARRQSESIIQRNIADYDLLFQQDRVQSVSVTGF